MVSKKVRIKLCIYLLLDSLVLGLFSVSLGTDQWSKLEHNEPVGWKQTALPPGTKWITVALPWFRIFNSGLFSQCMVPPTISDGHVKLIINNSTQENNHRRDFDTVWR